MVRTHDGRIGESMIFFSTLYGTSTPVFALDDPPPPQEANRVYLGSTDNPVYLGSTDNPVYLGSNGT